MISFTAVYRCLVVVCLCVVYFWRRYRRLAEPVAMPKAKKTDLVKSPVKTPYEKTGSKKAVRSTTKDAESSGESSSKKRGLCYEEDTSM